MNKEQEELKDAVRDDLHDTHREDLKVASKGATVPSGAKSDNLPSLIASLPSTNTVTYNLTGGASASVTPSKAIAGQGFSVKLKAPAGYALSNVTITMGGNDITNQVFTPDAEGGGGSSVQTQSGTFIGGGGNTATISCNFVPRVIYIHGDLSQAPSLRGIVSIELVKDMYIAVTADSSTSAYAEYLLYLAHEISDYSTDTDNPYATYSNGTLTIDTVYNSGTARWASGITYNYELIGW